MIPFYSVPGASVSTPPGTGGGGGGGGLNPPTRLAGAATLTNAKNNVFANTSGGAFTLTLPAAPVDGQTVSFFDNALTWNTNNLTIAANAGQTISSLSLPANNPLYYGATAVATVQGGRVTFMFDATLNRWST